MCIRDRYTDGHLHAVKADKGGRPGKVFKAADFEKTAMRSTDCSVPMLWPMTDGVVPKTPPLTAKSGGGHVRVVIG